MLPAGSKPGGELLCALRKDDDPRLAVIVGSGPSLKDFDRKQLSKNWTFTIVINDEYWRAEGVFEPDLWIYNDPNFYHRQAGRKMYSDTPIVTSSHVYNAVKDLPEKHPFNPALWTNTAVYQANASIWNPTNGEFIVHRTTATAALCLAHWMGFRSAALFGVDMYSTNDDYYYDGSAHQKARRRRERMYVETGGPGVYSNHWQMAMMSDMRKWKSFRDRVATEMEVYQCSVKSPMTCFPRRTWAQAIAEHNQRASRPSS